jgi:hypothetical protein
MCECALNTFAGGLENVFTHDLGVYWREFPVPVDPRAVGSYRHALYCRGD